MSDGELNCGSTEDCGENWNREVYFSQILEEVCGIPTAATQGGQGRMLAEKSSGPGVMTSLGSRWGALGTLAKAGLVSSNQKEWGFI